MTLAEAVSGEPGAQVLLAVSEAQRDMVASMFPAAVAIWANGAGDWDALAGRSVVAFSEALAAAAAPHAKSVKLIAEPLPDPLPEKPLAWARKFAVVYVPGAGDRHSQHVAEKRRPPDAPDAPAPTESTSAPEQGGDVSAAPPSAVAGTIAIPPPLTPARVADPQTYDEYAEVMAEMAALDSVEGAGATQPAEPPPPIPFPPEASLERPKPRKRHLRAVFNGNTVLEADPDEAPLPAAMSEDHVADQFAAAQKDELRYIAARNMWLVWSDSYWKPDAKKEVDRRVVEHCRAALHWPEAAPLTPEGKRKLGSRRFAGSVRDFTQSDRRIAAEWEQFGRDPYLLGVPGGVVDLQTGKLIEAEREHYITRQTAVAPEKGAPETWIAFLTHICKGDDSLVDYMQRWCGYLISGDTSEECLLFCYGPTQRGKSKFVGALREMMGTYAVTANMDTFTESRMERHSEELAALAGARMIVASETEAGRRWNESRIKALTGRDTIRARMLHENSFEFALGKIVIAGNHAPALRNVDDTFRRRLHILEFSNPVPEDKVDRALDAKLRAEYPRILQWCIEGFLAWKDYGLGKPESIINAVDQYLESEDTLAEWLQENTVSDAVARVQSGDLYSDYRRWAEAAGEFVLSQKRFVQQLSERGFSRARAAGKRYVVGLRLVAETKRYDDPYK